MLVTGASGGIAAAVGTAFAELARWFTCGRVRCLPCRVALAMWRPPRWVAAASPPNARAPFSFSRATAFSGFITGQTIAVNGGLSLN